MKQIQWFPGHMFKSLREIKEKIKLMDIVFILLDARLPYSSMNPNILEIVGNKPVLLLFNKADLADPKNLNYWSSYYQKKGFSVLLINSITGKNVNKIHASAKEVLKDKINRNQNKGLKEMPIRTMILGIPNVGKSTLINCLTKSKATKTGNRPGVTKAQQWIKISQDFELLDTPGVLWPKFEEEKVGLALAVTGAIKDDTLPIHTVVTYALNYLQTYYQKALNLRYKVDADMNADQIIEAIAKLRGCLIKGQEIDYDRVYQIVLTDIRNNVLGGLSFDQKPSTI